MGFMPSRVKNAVRCFGVWSGPRDPLLARGIYPFFMVVVFVEKYLCRGSMIGLLL
jgi:hypothetical protein